MLGSHKVSNRHSSNKIGSQAQRAHFINSQGCLCRVSPFVQTYLSLSLETAHIHDNVDITLICQVCLPQSLLCVIKSSLLLTSHSRGWDKLFKIAINRSNLSLPSSSSKSQGLPHTSFHSFCKFKQTTHNSFGYVLSVCLLLILSSIPILSRFGLAPPCLGCNITQAESRAGSV